MFSANFTLFQTLLSATLTSSVVIASGFYQSARATTDNNNLPDATQMALRFESPGDAAPESSIGGGVRGSLQFSAPDSAAPRTSIGGGVRGSVQFGAPGSAAPRTSIGGGVRGSLQFSAPDSAAPRTSIGGGVRGGVRFLAPDESAPRNSDSGGIRGEVEFQLPDDSAPRTSESGGVRGNDTPPLTALLPSTQTGRTLSARPTFFVYLPPTTSQQAFFSVQDEQGNFVYHTVVNISTSGETIAIATPEDAPELEVGKNYLWMFAPLEPNGILRPDNSNVVGWVKRVEPVASSPEVVLSPVEQATEYAAAGIWYDTLEVLASAQLEQPSDETLASEWQDLLTEVGLEQVSTEPVSLCPLCQSYN
ncbi:MAG: DUF928 domain-containing protein [Geitlerinemataceae cyanobacterium]